MYTYDEAFYKYIEKGAIESAQVLIPLVKSVIPLKDVLDVGCGRGAWLDVWRNSGVDVLGIDGDYVDRESLRIPKECFDARDLVEPFSLNRMFSLVQCLEVAEHLPEASASTLIKTLCEHGDLVLFSAAPPGQGGENHINEQPYEYWRSHFSNNGFVCLDPFRESIRNNPRVQDWYKYNVFLYCRESVYDNLPESLKAKRVSNDKELKDVSPPIYKFRKWIITNMSPAMMTLLAKLKKHMINMRVKLGH